MVYTFILLFILLYNFLPQHQVKNVEQTEVDTSGRCEVTYKLVDATHITKLKRNCQNVTPVPFFNQTNKVGTTAMQYSILKFANSYIFG